MDLLIEKGDSRTYLSQLKVLVTKFEEGAPAITRNSTQIQGRNGNVDFGGWHTSKEIEVEGFYRADDLDEETILRERLYALLSDTDGFYITEMRGELTPDFERPGENEGNLYEQLTTRPSHKRFFVYAKSIEPELQGNIGGAVLYKLTMTFTTMKLPYGESVPRDLDVKPNVPYYGDNLYIDTENFNDPTAWYGWSSHSKTGEKYNGLTVMKSDSDWEGLAQTIQARKGETYTFSVYARYAGGTGNSNIYFRESKDSINTNIGSVLVSLDSTWKRVTGTVIITDDGPIKARIERTAYNTNTLLVAGMKLEKGTVATPWSPAPSDPGYNKWYLNTYYNTDNLVIPYAGTVPCSQLEQGFIVEFTAKQAGGNLVITLNGTEFKYNNQVYSDDVFKLSGYEYTKNGISVVKSTNKAYFKLLPGITNKISSSPAGEIRILNFQNLYA
ncbi:phage head spike fiber domain-containing protein [Lactiplantibacillus argentoratensis]|uniref:phage head spike fiber domain-containing protein n=1 Tax=Lactiplantibacillus argentoratensis TaxID=271881 RepID=UPI001D08D4EE|nr:phage tail domain-containing protein [Lactiplantibacillus argentoratensis]MCB7463380.1 phage tail family protein [Lactiplantibacillus argentoratensis]